jgi:hypothetical protein
MVDKMSQKYCPLSFDLNFIRRNHPCLRKSKKKSVTKIHEERDKALSQLQGGNQHGEVGETFQPVRFISVPFPCPWSKPLPIQFLRILGYRNPCVNIRAKCGVQMPLGLEVQ